MAPKKPKPKPKPSKYSWTLSTDGVKCFKSQKGGQTLLPMLQAQHLSAAHDQQLSHATAQINAILRNVVEANVNQKRTLGFIEFRNRLLLVWAEYDVIGPDDDDDVIATALGLPPLPEELEEEPEEGTY